MKKFKTMMAMMLALVSMCVAFSSCSSDDDGRHPAFDPMKNYFDINGTWI